MKQTSCYLDLAINIDTQNQTEKCPPFRGIQVEKDSWSGKICYKKDDTGLNRLKCLFERVKGLK